MFKICTYDALAIGETFTKNVVFVEKVYTREIVLSLELLHEKSLKIVTK